MKHLLHQNILALPVGLLTLNVRVLKSGAVLTDMPNRKSDGKFLF